ncbi:hypothetical protein SAMN02983003_0644 [Devosia enhydra]|uniref:Uncharacterized protein n=1 Tax=Devosia enhydra TaxID=665118 RepID=A0A1K2HTV5_9HYPH|nr:hypothetical protein [Devosia enhydra]SFZ81703.1 hypothetical protein SAMN02983003_0644 [Devosia enhydra]
MLGIRIRMGAAHYDLTTPEGVVFDMARLDRSERRKLTRLVRDIYSKHIEGN